MASEKSADLAASLLCCVCHRHTAIVAHSSFCKCRNATCPSCAMNMAAQPDLVRFANRHCFCVMQERGCPLNCSSEHALSNVYFSSECLSDMTVVVRSLGLEGAMWTRPGDPDGTVRCELCDASIWRNAVQYHLTTRCEANGIYSCPKCEVGLQLAPCNTLHGDGSTLRLRLKEALDRHAASCTKVPCTVSGCGFVGTCDEVRTHHADTHAVIEGLAGALLKAGVTAKTPNLLHLVEKLSFFLQGSPSIEQVEACAADLGQAVPDVQLPVKRRRGGS